MIKMIQAHGLEHMALNEKIRDVQGDCVIDGCCGQRFIAAGMADKSIVIRGTPGNALGAYLNGASITVEGNAQDAVGDTMNGGRIIVRGNIGDQALCRFELFVELFIARGKLAAHLFLPGKLLFQGRLFFGKLVLCRLQVVDDPLITVHDLADKIRGGEHLGEVR